MIKLQPGDYVSTEGMTEEQYHAVCNAFIAAGAKLGESNKFNYFRDRVADYLGWNDLIGVYWDGDYPFYEIKRELTIDQILGSDNTEGAKAMTKVTVFGQNEQVKSEKKPIEFVYALDSVRGRTGYFEVSPEEYDNLCLLGRDEYKKYDLIMAWDTGDTARLIYLGHWNDGVVS